MSPPILGSPNNRSAGYVEISVPDIFRQMVRVLRFRKSYSTYLRASLKEKFLDIPVFRIRMDSLRLFMIEISARAQYLRVIGASQPYLGQRRLFEAIRGSGSTHFGW